MVFNLENGNTDFIKIIIVLCGYANHYCALIRFWWFSQFLPDVGTTLCFGSAPNLFFGIKRLVALSGKARPVLG